MSLTYLQLFDQQKMISSGYMYALGKCKQNDIKLVHTAICESHVIMFFWQGCS